MRLILIFRYSAYTRFAQYRALVCIHVTTFVSRDICMAQETRISRYLVHDPFRIFMGSRTPAGLYARQKWMGQEQAGTWKRDSDMTLVNLRAGQYRNGSWNNSVLMTVRKLFGLHLTARKISSEIEHALEWLLKRKTFLREEAFSGEKSGRVAPGDIKGLPFSGGCVSHFVKGAVLFLSTVFGKADDERVVRLYERLCVQGEAKEGIWCSWTCSHNILRAFVVHPAYAESSVVDRYVHALARGQDRHGAWAIPVPYFHTVNALGHLSHPEAERLLRRSFQRLKNTQNADGTWGTHQKEWNTFLIIHAMKRKAELLLC